MIRAVTRAVGLLHRGKAEEASVGPFSIQASMASLACVEPCGRESPECELGHADLIISGQ